MMNLLRALTALSGLGLLLVGLGWWVHPAAAAEMLPVLSAGALAGTHRNKCNKKKNFVHMVHVFHNGPLFLRLLSGEPEF